jgi:hypothetical protein
MAEKPIALFAFSAVESASTEAEVLKERNGILSQWQGKKEVEVQSIEGSSQELKEALHRYKGRLISLHLSGEAFWENDKPDWLTSLIGASALKLVFLSGNGLQQRVSLLLEQGSKGVIASQSIGKRNAVYRFADQFYHHLLAGKSLLNSFEKMAEYVQDEYELGYRPSARFFHANSDSSSFPWGLYLTPENQHVLSWKLPVEEEAMTSVFVPIPPDFDPTPPRKKKGISWGINFDFLQNIYKNLFRAVKTSPSLPHFPPPSPRIVTKKDANRPGGGLENLTEDNQKDLTLQIAEAKKMVSEEEMPELYLLEDEWAELSTAYKEKTLLKKMIEGKLPFLTYHPGRIEELIENALSDEIYGLNVKLLEHKLNSFLQPATRGFLIRKPKPKLEVGKYHALIIGINQYDGEGIKSLSRPLQDARQLHKVLQDKYEFTHLELIENPDKDTLLMAFETLEQQAEEGDNVLIFYAGHGEWEEGPDPNSGFGYWLPKDAQKNSRIKWIENSYIHNSIKRLHACQHVLLISDSCFGGALLNTRDANTTTEAQSDKAIGILYKSKSRQILTSGAKEPVPDDSQFFKHLHEALDTAPKQNFSAQRLFHQIQTKVLNDLQVGQNPQIGKILHAGDDGGDFVFVRKG